jgi:hypothetical protein
VFRPGNLLRGGARGIYDGGSRRDQELKGGHETHELDWLGLQGA